MIATVHQPWVNSNTAHSMGTEGVPIQQALEKVLYDARVDLVLSGHVHAYGEWCVCRMHSCALATVWW